MFAIPGMSRLGKCDAVLLLGLFHDFGLISAGTYQQTSRGRFRPVRRTSQTRPLLRRTQPGHALGTPSQR